MKKSNTSRSHDYKKELYERIKDDDNHPYNLGIEMQAHHLISISGMKKSGLSSQVETTGYDINHPKNCVFLPSTLKGACHLKVQVHKSAHTNVVFGDDADSAHSHKVRGKNYHDFVSDLLIDIKDELDNSCNGDEFSDNCIDLLNDISKDIILSRICNAPHKAPLSRFYAHFKKDGPGCGGEDSLKNLNPDAMTPCDMSRNHESCEDVNSKVINYPFSSKPRKFKPGQ